jgi:hypothetical protein
MTILRPAFRDRLHVYLHNSLAQPVLVKLAMILRSKSSSKLDVVQGYGPEYSKTKQRYNF